MKRFILKIILIMSPFIIALAIELFILPVDFFTFRIWEALATTEIIGENYPNYHIIKKEKGDKKGFKSKYIKLNEWYTDKYGFRNRPEVCNREKFDIIVIGDSNIVGSYLDHKDILSEVLERKTNLSVYSYSRGNSMLHTFLNDERFNNNPPKVLIYEIRAGEIINDFVINGNAIINNYGEFVLKKNKMKKRLPDQLLIIKSKLNKQIMYNFIKARIGAAIWKENFKNLKESEDINNLIYKYLKFFNYINDELRKRDINFILFILPTYERRADPLIPLLIDSGINLLAYLPNEKYPYGIDLDWFYHKEDSHWTEEAVEFTADELIKIINEMDDEKN